MGRISNKHPRKVEVIADPGIAGRVKRAKALRVNVVAVPTDPNAFLGNVAPMQIIEETDSSNTQENEPMNVYESPDGYGANLIPNAEPVLVYVVSGSLGGGLPANVINDPLDGAALTDPFDGTQITDS